MRKTPTRDKLKNSSQIPQDLNIGKIIDEIKSTDMDFVPDYDVDLSLASVVGDSAVKYFFDGLTDNSKRLYGQALEQYCIFHRITPKQLIKESLNDDEKVPIMRKHISKLNTYVKFIEKEGYDQHMSDGTIVNKKYAPKSVLGKVVPIKSFYEKFGITIPKKSVTLSEPPEPLDKDDDEYITIKYDIREVLNNDKVSSLLKCIILGQTSSGLLPVDIYKLTIGQYEKGKTTVKKSITDKDGNEKLVDVKFCTLVVKRQKNKKRSAKPFVTFFSPEACEKIDGYLLQRNISPMHEDEAKNIDVESYLELPLKERNNPKINQFIAYQKQRYDIDIENGASPDDLLLFVNQTIDHSFLKTRNDEDRKITIGASQKMYFEASRKCGLLAPKYERNKITGQKMRSFFSHTLENGTSRPKLIRHMMGHKSGAVENAYYNPHQETLKSFYVTECLPLLQFIETEAVRLVDKDFIRLKTLESENVELKIQYEEQEKQNAEILKRLETLETQKDFNNAMDMLRGEESTYIDENGDTVTYTITDDNNAAIIALRKFHKLLDMDENLDVETILAMDDDEYEKLIESVEV